MELPYSTVITVSSTILLILACCLVIIGFIIKSKRKVDKSNEEMRTELRCYNEMINLGKFHLKLETVARCIIFHGMYLDPKYRTNNSDVIQCSSLKLAMWDFLTETFEDKIQHSEENGRVITSIHLPSPRGEIIIERNCTGLHIIHPFRDLIPSEEESEIFNVLYKQFIKRVPYGTTPVERMHQLCINHYRELEVGTNIMFTDVNLITHIPKKSVHGNSVDLNK